MRSNSSTSNQKPRERRDKRRFWLCLEAACLAAFLVVAIVLAIRFTRQNQRSAEERAAQEALIRIQIEQTVAPTSAPTSAPTNAPTNAPAPSETPPQMFAYAQELLQINGDLVGMVGFDDMALYVCQGEDNSYYASHRFNGSEDPAGMIYMDYRCSAWPLGQNTILYGHNIRDGSRFGKLNRMTRAKYLAKHPYVRYATLYEIRDYRPIAVFYANVDPSAADYFNFTVTDFSDADSFTAYVQEAKRRSVVEFPATAQYGDKLLTLATCSEEGVGGRLIIVCVPAE